MKRLLLASTALAFAGQAWGAPPPQPVSWTGCHVGGQIGADWGSANFVNPSGGFFSPANSGIGIGQGSSFVFGPQVGCDYEFASHWVIGAAGDFSWTNLDGTAVDPFFGGKGGLPITLRDNTQWLVTVTGRIGYAWDRWMVYGKGGAAWEHSNDSIQNLFTWGTPGAFCFAGGFVACNPSGSETNAGWTVGFGFSYALTDRWSAGFEYDHYGFPGHTVTLTSANIAPPTSPSAPISVSQNIDAAKFTINYRFWLGP